MNLNIKQKKEFNPFPCVFSKVQIQHRLSLFKMCSRTFLTNLSYCLQAETSQKSRSSLPAPQVSRQTCSRLLKSSGCQHFENIWKISIEIVLIQCNIYTYKHVHTSACLRHNSNSVTVKYLLLGFGAL